MKVLFVNRMASIERGGGETFDLEISRHLEARGCEISYLTGLPLFGRARTPIQHPRAYTIRTPYLGWIPWDVMKGGWRLRVFDVDCFSRAAAHWAAARADSFDVIQVCELPEFVRVWRSLRVRVPVVVRLTAPNFHDPRGSLSQADALMASGTSMETLRAKGLFPHLHDIPNAVDTSRFRPHGSPIRERLGIPPDALVLLYAARFQAFKNHAMLIDALERVVESRPEAVLLLIGSGPLKERIEQQVASRGLSASVRFLGEIPFHDMPDYYAAANLKVVSSDYESFCFAALEAMATGLPIVSTNGGWVPRLLGEPKCPSTEPADPALEFRQGGIVTPVGRAESFAAAILAVLEHASLRKEMGHFNRAQAEREHGWDRSAELLLALYQQLIEKRKTER